MTQPRCILPGSTYLITRRTLRRHHLLRPDPATNNLFIYAIAICAQRYQIRVHALCVMSTHYHLVATDVLGHLPQFLAQLHRIVALALKVMRKWEGPVWDHESTSLVRLETHEAIVDKIAYCLANPVAAGLVSSSFDWPGVLVGGTRRTTLRSAARRPVEFFDPENSFWPSRASLELSLPPTLSESERGAFDLSVSRALEAHEHAARANIRAQGWKFLSAKRVLSTSPYERATSFEPLRSLNPTFAVGAVRLAYARAVDALRKFRSAYREAFANWRAGVRTAVFPAGTWLMSLCHAVCVAPT